jgi:hypothetical protein
MQEFLGSVSIDSEEFKLPKVTMKKKNIYQEVIEENSKDQESI